MIAFKIVPFLIDTQLQTMLPMFKAIRSSCSVRLLRTSAVFAFTLSTDKKGVPLSTDLIFGNRQKSQGARSGEQDGCSSTVMFLVAKNCFTDSALWAGTLSWCKIHLFLHNSGHFLLTRSRSSIKTSV